MQRVYFTCMCANAFTRKSRGKYTRPARGRPPSVSIRINVLGPAMFFRRRVFRPIRNNFPRPDGHLPPPVPLPPPTQTIYIYIYVHKFFLVVFYTLRWGFLRFNTRRRQNVLQYLFRFYAIGSEPCVAYIFHTKHPAEFVQIVRMHYFWPRTVVGEPRRRRVSDSYRRNRTVCEKHGRLGKLCAERTVSGVDDETIELNESVFFRYTTSTLAPSAQWKCIVVRASTTWMRLVYICRPKPAAPLQVFQTSLSNRSRPGDTDRIIQVAR